MTTLTTAPMHVIKLIDAAMTNETDIARFGLLWILRATAERRASGSYIRRPRFVRFSKHLGHSLHEL